MTFKKINRSAKRDYYYNKCVEFKSNTKRLWQMINTVTGKALNKKSVIDSIRVGNIEHTDRKIVSNTICKYFANIGKEFSNNIATSRVCHALTWPPLLPW